MLTDTFIVDTTIDAIDANPGDGVCDDGAGNCTLRAAIMEANAVSGAATITLPAGTYTLSIAGVSPQFSGSLAILDDLTISGAGADTTIVDAGGLYRVFWVTQAPVAISGLTITGGLVRDNNVSNRVIWSFGGGIWNDGKLKLTSVTVSGNTGSAPAASETTAV